MAATHLILCADQVVAVDLTEILQDLQPDARILTAFNFESASSLLQRQSRLDAAFICVPAAKLAIWNLDDDIERLGGQILVLNGEKSRAYAKLRRWPVICSPFTPEVIGAALASVQALSVHGVADARPTAPRTSNG